MCRTELFHNLRDGDAEGGEVVQESANVASLVRATMANDTNMELRDLTFEIPRPKALTERFDAVRLRFGAVSAEVSTPSSPLRTAKVFRHP